MNLRDSLEAHQLILPFNYVGRAKGGRLSHAWNILRNRSTFWTGKDPWPTFPSRDVLDLMDENKRQREELAKLAVEQRRYEALIDTLNAKLPQADRVVKPQPATIIYTVSGGGGSGSVPAPETKLPKGYQWPANLGFKVGDAVRLRFSASGGTIESIMGDVAFVSKTDNPYLDPVLLNRLEPAK